MPKMPWTKRIEQTQDSIIEAKHAAASARTRARQVASQWARVNQTADYLDEQLEKNHVVERFRLALGGSK